MTEYIGKLVHLGWKKRLRKFFAPVQSYYFGSRAFPYPHDIPLLDKPIYLRGRNSVAVLYIHGWSSVPYESYRLGQYLNLRGYTYSAPMLRGHGTVPKDLEGVSWRMWLEDAQHAYRSLKEDHETVLVIGMSMGGSLAALLAAKEEIDGFIFLGTPYAVRNHRLLRAVGQVKSRFIRYNKKFYIPLFKAFPSPGIARMLSYQTYPSRSGIEALDVIKEAQVAFTHIVQPSLIIQSRKDMLLEPHSIHQIYKRLGATHKRKLFIPDAYHNFISDRAMEYVFNDIEKFIRSVTRRKPPTS